MGRPYLFDAYACYGRMILAEDLLKGRMNYSPKLLDAIYRCNMCGACDSGCKRNTDLEPLLVLEGLRAKCVNDGQGPMPEHKKIAENITNEHNRYGSPHGNRPKWLPNDIKPASKANVMSFVDCVVAIPCFLQDSLRRLRSKPNIICKQLKLLVPA